jgi:primosomal replication protein N''
VANLGAGIVKAQLQLLQQQLTQLAAKASQLDKQVPNWQHSSRIDSEWFQTRSPFLLDYVQESLSIQQRLQQSLTAGSQQLLAERLSRQLDILLKAFHSDEIRRKETPARWVKTNKTAAVKSAQPAVAEQRQRAGLLLQQLGGNGQALYHQLAEYHGFERRLEQMIQDAAATNQPVAMQLALQARLGRCRKAISAMEAEIEWYEQKGSRRG